MEQVKTIVDLSEVVISLVTIQDDDFPLPVLAVCFDQHGKHNIMSKSFFSCLGFALDVAHRFTREDRISAVVFCSAKATFCVGADIDYQLEMNTLQLCTESVLSAQEVLSLVEALSVPTIAVINGLALGGGLEFCLACDYRVADWQHGRMGLPEVHVGVLPALGGCARLPRLIGFKPALKLLLTGRTIRATEAQSIGLVDALVSNCKSADDGRLVYHWIVELSQHWRTGKLGGPQICSATGPVEKGTKAPSKSGNVKSGNSKNGNSKNGNSKNGNKSAASGKGTARARLMRPNQPAADKVPQRRIAYKVGHLQNRSINLEDIRLLNDPNLIESLLSAADAKNVHKYPSRWSCWTHAEQMVVYYSALRSIRRESRAMFPAPYLCLLATLNAWQMPSVLDACAMTVEPYAALALSPEAVSLMASFLDVRKCSRRSRLFRMPAAAAATAAAAAAVLPQQRNTLSVPGSGNPRQERSSPNVSDASDNTGDDGARKRKKKKKKKKNGNGGDEGPNAAGASGGLTPPIARHMDTSSESDSRPASASGDHSARGDGSGSGVESKESVQQVVTLVGDASAYSIALLLQLLVAEVPVFLLAPNQAIAHAMLSRVRLQMNHQLKYGSLTPTLKVARLSNLKGSCKVEHWDSWLSACCKDLHKIYWDQQPGSTTRVAHLVVVASTVDADTYTLDELSTLCNSLTVTKTHQSVLLRSCCVFASPTSYVRTLSRRVEAPHACLQMQGFNIDSSKMRCVEVTAFTAVSEKDAAVETDPWFVRSLSTFINKIGRTPVVASMPLGPSISVRLALMCLEVEFRLAIYGGQDLYDADQLFPSVGFQVSPLQFLSKIGVSSIVRLSQSQCRYRTLFTVLDTLIKATVTEKLGEEDVRIFANSGQAVAPKLAAAVKQCRKWMVPEKPALGKLLRAWSTQQRAMACLMACVSESVRFLGAVDEAVDMDLLLAGGLPSFPICQGGPLFYGERIGWESVADKTERLLEKGIFSDLATAEHWPLSGDDIEHEASKRYVPILSEGAVVQTMFPRRPQGLPVSRGLRGLMQGYRRMPWFSSSEAPLWFCLHVVLFMFVVLLIIFWMEVHAGATIRMPWA